MVLSSSFKWNLAAHAAVDGCYQPPQLNCHCCWSAGHSLPGLLGGSVLEVIAGALFAAGVVTEGYKYIDGTGQI